MSFAPYRCPLCRLALVADAGGYTCSQGHRFDRAREGYVNLLPVQHKHSRDPGDSADMLGARRRFLTAGHYAPLIFALQQQLPRQGRLLDAGCGEGWYTSQLCAERPLAADGIDISRAAIRMAARSHRAQRFAVASSYALPFADRSFDAGLNIFAPLEPAEMRRVLRPGAPLLRLSAGPRHLYALKALIYSEVRLHPDTRLSLPGFEREHSETLRFGFVLDSPDALSDLIRMTPYGWKSRQLTAAEQAAALPLTIEAEVILSRYV